MSRSATKTTRTFSHEGHEGKTRKSRFVNFVIFVANAFVPFVAHFSCRRGYASRPRAVSACLVAAMLMGRVAEGQDEFKQSIVVTAADTPVALGSVTRTLTVITREQIAQLPVHSIADVLRLASSVDVRARGERGVQTDFAVRGANFGQMLVLVDGVRLNDAQSGHHNGDIPVPLDAIERIEVLHGPGSSLFGAD